MRLISRDQCPILSDAARHAETQWTKFTHQKRLSFEVDIVSLEFHACAPCSYVHTSYISLSCLTFPVYTPHRGGSDGQTNWRTAVPLK